MVLNCCGLFAVLVRSLSCLKIALHSFHPWQEYLRLNFFAVHPFHLCVFAFNLPHSPPQPSSHNIWGRMQVCHFPYTMLSVSTSRVFS
jgi:hypothetical protein